MVGDAEVCGTRALSLGCESSHQKSDLRRASALVDGIAAALSAENRICCALGTRLFMSASLTSFTLSVCGCKTWCVFAHLSPREGRLEPFPLLSFATLRLFVTANAALDSGFLLKYRLVPRELVGSTTGHAARFRVQYFYETS